MLINDLIDLSLLFKCCCLVIFLYSGFIALLELSFYYLLISISIYFLILYISVNAPNEETVKNVLGDDPRKLLRHSSNIVTNTSAFSIAHRIATFDGEAKPLEAVKLCSRNGCKLVHVDVRVSADNQGVICNNDSLTQSNDNSVIMEKSIEECDFQEVLNKSRTNVQEIPRLEEVLALCNTLNMKIMINVIYSSYHKSFDSVVDFVCSLYEKNPQLYEKCIISSSNSILLYKIRKNNPKIVTALYWICYSDQPKTSISWLKKFRINVQIQQLLLEFVDTCRLYLLNNFIYRIIGNSAIIFPKTLITPGYVENWERKNIRCLAAVVNLSSEKLYYANALGIAYLTDTLINNSSNVPS